MPGDVVAHGTILIGHLVHECHPTRHEQDGEPPDVVFVFEIRNENVGGFRLIGGYGLK